MAATAKVFNADLDRFNRQIVEAGALRTAPDGFQWVDETRIPVEVARAYRLLLQYGYANGLI